MNAADDRVGLEHEITSCLRLYECGVVGQSKCPGIGRNRGEETRDQAVLS